MADDEVLSGAAKLVLVQCACGRWRADLHLLEGGMIYGNETFDSKDEAALVMTARLIQMGLGSSQLGKTH